MLGGIRGISQVLASGGASEATPSGNYEPGEFN